MKSQLAHLFQVKQVAAVEYDQLPECCADLVKVRRAEFVPLGGNQQRIGVFKRLVLVIGILYSIPNTQRRYSSLRGQML